MCATASAYSFCSAVALGPGAEGMGGADAGDGEREGWSSILRCNGRDWRMCREMFMHLARAVAGVYVFPKRA